MLWVSLQNYYYPRKLRYSLVIYVDDSLLATESYNECISNTEDTRALLEKPQFPYTYKSIFTRKQKITFLQFDIVNVAMTILLTQEKEVKMKNLCSNLLSLHHPTIRQTTCILGNIAAALEAAPCGRLH